ncbi:MAG: nickel pincer cofactor biosynthesis protein LarC [Candidatus Binatia bacterium]
MKIAYGDLIGGVSGDMFVAALIDLGLSLNKLRSGLKKIPALKFEIKAAKKTVHAIRATRFQVLRAKDESPRSWKQIRDLIKRSKFGSEIKTTGIEIFTCLAEAEAKIHGVAVDKVHFHEIGATDSIIDIMAAAIGIHELGIEAFHFSQIPLGRGITRSQHGPLPVPGPATLELLRGLPVFGVAIGSETVTPTGAALVRALGKSFGEPPSMTIEEIGYGTGRKEFPARPNLFRLLVGRVRTAWTNEQMLMLETNIDDMNPQLYDHVMERLFSAGARDVFLSSIQMKKNRPATLLAVICEPAQRERLIEIILQETTTIGVRYHAVNRVILPRQSKKIKTRYGEVAVKIVEQFDGRKRATPEYDDIRHIADAKKLPIKLIHDEVLRIAGKNLL